MSPPKSFVRQVDSGPPVHRSPRLLSLPILQKPRRSPRLLALANSNSGICKRSQTPVIRPELGDVWSPPVRRNSCLRARQTVPWSDACITS